LAPQHFTAPDANNAHEWASPVARAVAPDNPDTATGTDESVVEPFPNCPYSFEPQHCTAPDANNAHEWDPPAATAVTPDDKPDTTPGTRESVVELFPNCPSGLRPQHLTPPEAVNAHEWP
jgi:hypothetical protein